MNKKICILCEDYLYDCIKCANHNVISTIIKLKYIKRNV